MPGTGVCVQFSWPVSKVDMKRLNTWERKILGRIYELVIEQGSWRMRTNQELCKLHKDFKPEVCGFDSRWCHWNFSLT
jgi:hypothetical protein